MSRWKAEVVEGRGILLRDTAEMHEVIVNAPGQDEALRTSKVSGMETDATGRMKARMRIRGSTSLRSSRVSRRRT